MVELATDAFGIVDLAQLRSLGIDKRAAWRRVGRGRLHRLHVGVYSVVPPMLLRAEGHWLAAVRAGGPRAALSLRAAAALWDMRGPPTGPVHVTVPSAGGRRRRSGLVVHRCPSLRPEEVTVHSGIPVTTPARTLRDLKRTESPARFDALLRRAEQAGLDIGVFGIVEDLDATKLERRLLALCRRHRLPPPRTQHVIGPYTVDFLWPSARLIVETDGFSTHGTRVDFEADRARDAWLTTQGYRVVRFTWRRLHDDPATVMNTLRRLLRVPA